MATRKKPDTVLCLSDAEWAHVKDHDQSCACGGIGYNGLRAFEGVLIDRLGAAQTRIEAALVADDRNLDDIMGPLTTTRDSSGRLLRAAMVEAGAERPVEGSDVSGDWFRY